MTSLRSRSVLLVAVLATALLAAGCGNDDEPGISIPFQIIDLVVGTGPEVDNGDAVLVAFTGWLYDMNALENKGMQFDQSTEDGFSFIIGAGQVIAGWDAGVRGMRVGGQRRLIIPPGLGFGSGGQGSIPPDATLVFDIELLEIL